MTVKATARMPKTGGGEFYHVRIREDEVGKFVILTGDPDRPRIVSRYLERPKKVSAHREFTVYNGYVGPHLVTVASTGIGSPATAIAVEELARAGGRTFIRVGTCGALRREIALGDLIIANAAVKMEGTSIQYAPQGYPAVASIDVFLALKLAASKLGLSYHSGFAASSDTFYVGQGRPGFKGYLPSQYSSILRDLAELGVLCFEMESSALFTIAGVYGLRAGAIFAVVANRVTDTFGVKGVEEACRVGVEAIRYLTQWDSEAKRRKLPVWLPQG